MAASTTIDSNLVKLRQHLTISCVNTEQELDSLIKWQGLTHVDNFKSFSSKDAETIKYFYIQAQETSPTHRFQFIIKNNLKALIY